MVYKITSVINAVGAGIQNPYLIRVVGNPLFPLIGISLLFIIILAAITYKSKTGWKLFSVAAILTLSGTAAILFLNKYMAGKVNGGSSNSFTGGNTNVHLPDVSFFSNEQPTAGGNQTTDLPHASFDDLFQ